MATYRIVELYSRGSISYYVQRKFLWWWIEDRKVIRIVSEEGLTQTYIQRFNTEQEAEDWIYRRRRLSSSPVKKLVCKEIII